MGSMWRRAIEYLGLAPDDEYDDVEAYEDPRDRQAPASRVPPRSAQPSRTVVPPALEAERERGPVVRPLTINPTRTVGEGEDDVDRIQTRPMVVRPADQPAVAKPQIISPTSFAAAQEVADRFKATRPVIMNLQGLDRDIERRLIDFASGLCYGLGGHMEKVANHVFLLTPADVKVPEEERRRITERGLYES